MRTHCDGELWGLDYSQGTVFTVGDDDLLCEWDTHKHECSLASPLLSQGEATSYISEKTLKHVKLTASTMAKTRPAKCSRAVAYASKHDHIACAYLDGKVVIRKAESEKRNIYKVMTQPKEWSEVINYSPDQSLLAVGSHDNNIYIYDVINEYKLRTKLIGHGSYITCLDWAADTSYIRSNCGAYELLFFEIPADREKETRNDP